MDYTDSDSLLHRNEMSAEEEEGMSKKVVEASEE